MLAVTIAGGTGLLPLVGVIKFFIMGVWALGRRFWMCGLCSTEKRFRFLKTQDSWRLDLGGLVDMGGGNPGESSGFGSGG